MTAGGAGTPAGARIGCRRWDWRDATVLTGLAVLVALAFWEVVVQGRVFFFRDFALFFYPKRFYAAEAVRLLRIPFWESYGGCGEPFLGAYQSAIFYPPALIYYLLPMPASFMWFVVFHFFLSGAGAYYMMRAWGTRRAGAAFAAFAWAFSPAFISTVDNVSFQTSLAWLPWCLGLARRVYAGRGFGAFLWLTICFAMAVLAGAPEPVIFIAVVVALYAVARTIHITLRQGWRRAWKPALAVGGALVLGMALSGVELAPFLYALQYSARQQALDIGRAGAWSARPSDAVLWFLPRFYLYAGRAGIYWRSQDWLKTVYMGILVPFLAGWTLVLVRRRRNWFFAGTAALFAALALGSNFPLWLFLYEHLPGFALLRFPVKYFLPAAFALAVLAGFAVDDLQVIARKRETRRLVALLAVMLCVAVLFGALYVGSRVWDKQIFQAVTPPERFRTPTGQDVAVEQYESAQWSLGRSPVFLFAGAAALFVIAAIARARVRKPYGALALVVVLFTDIGIFGAHLNPVAGPQVYTEAPAHLAVVPNGVANSRLEMTRALYDHLLNVFIARVDNLDWLINYVTAVKGARFDNVEDYLKFLECTSAPRFRDAAEADTWFRSVNSPQFNADLEYQVFKESFYPNANLLYNVPMPETFEPMVVGRHYEILYAIKEKAVRPDRAAFLAYMWGASVIVDKQDAMPDFSYAPAVRPGSRAVLADRYVKADSDPEAKAVLTDTSVDVTKSPVLVGGDADAAAGFLGPGSQGSASADAAAPGTATVIADTGNVVTVEVDARKPALLFLSDCWYPLIHATVDGVETPTWRANYAYRAVPVPAGRHAVEFRYRPLDLYAGIAVTLAGIMALVAVWAIRHRRGKAQRPGAAQWKGEKGGTGGNPPTLKLRRAGGGKSGRKAD